MRVLPTFLLSLLVAAGTLPRAARGTETPGTDPAVATPFLGAVVEGAVDAPGQVESLIQLVAPPHQPFIEEGDADQTGTPIGTIPRLRQALLSIGYAAEFTPRREAGGIRLRVQLQAYDRVRQIFVSGNRFFVFGVRQEEIIRQLNIRPGQKLPPAGQERLAFMNGEADRLREYLRDLGYWDAKVEIEARDNGARPAAVNLIIHVDKGPGYPLEALTITGNKVRSTEDIDDVFRHFLRPFRRATLRRDINLLTEQYRKLGYPGARIRDDFNPNTSLDREKKEVNLGIEIKERRRLEVRFEGNTSRSSSSLRDDVTFFTRGAYDDVEAANSQEAIARGYRDRGHMLVKVAWRREHPDPDTERIIFRIDEGPEIRVKEVGFLGNQAIDAGSLAEVIRTHPYPFLGFLGLSSEGYASLRQIALDVTSLIDHYRSEGYLDAKVRAEIAPDPGEWIPLPAKGFSEREEARWRSAGGLRVRFHIEEGPLVWVAGMQFDAREADVPLPLDEEFLRSLLRTQLGGAFRESLIKRDETRLARQFGDVGYRHALVEAKTARHGDQVEIHWLVDLGPKVYVGPVFIRGNFLTRPSTILTWTELRTGDVLTTRRAERAQRNLALTQLFNNPNPIVFPSESRQAQVVPMVIEVEERHDHWGVFSLGAGLSTDQAAPSASFPLGFSASLGYQHRNLAGLGWTLGSLFEYGSEKQMFNASLLDPRLWGSLIRLEIAGNYLTQATVRLGDIKSGGGSLGFTREMAPGLDATLRYSLRNTSRTEILERGAGPDQNQGTVRVGTIIGSLSASAEWHRLDNLLVPAKGFKVSAGVELALPGFSAGMGADSFLKFSARSFSVIPLLRWLSIRHSVRYEQGFPLGGAALLPKVERYFAGGDTTIRGFQLDRAATEWVVSKALPGIAQVSPRPVGGNLRILHNVDLVFPLAPPLYGAVFLDSGLIAYSFQGLHASDFRHGAGVTPLLIRLPVGDLSLSFAVPLDRQPGDDTWRLHFNVGLMF